MGGVVVEGEKHMVKQEENKVKVENYKVKMRTAGARSERVQYMY